MFTVSSSSLLPPCNLLHFTTFLILHKGLPTMKNMKRKPWTKLGKKPVSSRKLEDSDEAAGFFPPPASSSFYIQNDSSHLLTFTCFSAEPALKTSSGWNLERFETFFIQQQKPSLFWPSPSTRKRLDSKHRAAGTCWEDLQYDPSQLHLMPLQKQLLAQQWSHPS